MSPLADDEKTDDEKTIRSPLPGQTQNFGAQATLAPGGVVNLALEQVTRIGPYVILKPLGEGGMGAVYLAEQTEPVRRMVALKLIKSGLNSPEDVARFAAERQALALMDHPNIAKVYDAGTVPLRNADFGLRSDESSPTARSDSATHNLQSAIPNPQSEGRPYFVMELVSGVPLSNYCDQARLTIPERLRLFIPICQAVQHAHQKGVIHRDLKPSNILVAEYDGRPVPKVIDFGLAKATAEKLTDRTLHTQFGQVLGTLQYMAPEQADTTKGDVDTRCDIYALGAILYELLTGTPPLSRDEISECSFLDLLEMIQEREAPPPSTRVRKLADATPVSAARQTDAARLAKDLAGDLDWIVMKALAKEREWRYESASAMALDLQRHLANEPVEASPPSTLYKASKFIRRHRAAVAVAATISTLVVVGSVVSAWLAVRATRAESIAKGSAAMARDEEKKAKQSEAEARAVLAFFENNVLAAARPADQAGGLGVDATIRAAVDVAEARIAASFTDLPLAEASVRDTLGSTYLYLGEAALSARQHEQALGLRQKHLGPEHAETLITQSNLAAAQRASGKLDLAVPLYRKTLAAMKDTSGAKAKDTLTCQNNLALALSDAGKFDEALALLQSTLQARTEVLGSEHADSLASLNNLAQAYQEAGKTDLALQWFEQARDKMRSSLGPNHPDTLTAMNNLAMAYRSNDKLALALPLLEEVHKKSAEVLGVDHPGTLLSANNLAIVYQLTGKKVEALPLLQAVWEKRQAKLGSVHSDTLLSLNNLALAYQAEGDLATALPLLEQGTAAWQAKFGPDHPNLLTSQSNLAIAYQTVGKTDLALPLFEQIERKRREAKGERHSETIAARIDLAAAYREAGRWQDAEPLFRALYEHARDKDGPTDRMTQVFLKHLLTCCENLKLPDKAEPLIRELALRAKEKDGAESPNYARYLVQLGLNLLEQKKPAEAEPVLRECLAVRQKNKPDDWTVFNTTSLVGECLLGQKKYADSEPLLVQGYEGLVARREQIAPQNRVRITEALDRVVRLYEDWEKPEEAAMWRAKGTVD